MTTNSANSRRKEAVPHDASQYVRADERATKARSLRDKAPRSSHAGWSKPLGRRDPIETLMESNEGRLPELVPLRFGRMSQSPFAFYRGAAAVMAADLATTPISGLRVQACGDAHLMNFGGFATPERNIIFDINDLDETLPAPFEWDLKRLAASIVIAAEHLKFSHSEAGRIVRHSVREYRERMLDYAQMHVLEIWYDRTDVREYSDKTVADTRKRIAERIASEQHKSAVDHLYPKLVSEQGALPRIKENWPLIYHPDPEQAPGLESEYGAAIALYRKSLPQHVKTLFDRFHPVDLAVKVVGVGSVGTRCAVYLFLTDDGYPLFLQVKEALASVLEPYAGKSQYRNHGERVIAGQRLMQTASDIFLGWTQGKNGRCFYVRQLRDMKLSANLEGWGAAILDEYGRACARALARAHARSGDPAAIAGYMGSGTKFDDAVGEFAIEYSRQNHSDYRKLLKAIKSGSIETIMDA